MSFSRIALFCSLAVNGILIAALLAVAPIYLMVRPINGAGDAGGGDFQVLGATDPVAIRNRLYLAQFPPEAARAVLHAFFTARDRPRREAIIGGADPVPYWTKTVSRGVYDPKIRDALADLDRKETAAVSVLVPGSDGDDLLAFASLRQDYGDLPSASLKNIAAVIDHYNGAVRAVAVNNVIATKDQEKVDELWRQEDAALQAVLTPDEYEIYLMHTSGTAWSLREKLRAFDPTEREFQELFELQYAFDRQWDPFAAHGARGPVLLVSDSRVDSARQQLETSIRSALGPKRYEDYVAFTDPAYLGEKSVVDDLGLPDTAVNRMLALRKESESRAAELRADRDLSDRDRRKALSALAEDAWYRVSGVLGPEGAREYRDRGCGRWIDLLRNPRKLVYPDP